jgi:hypothetical protein
MIEFSAIKIIEDDFPANIFYTTLETPRHTWHPLRPASLPPGRFLFSSHCTPPREGIIHELRQSVALRGSLQHLRILESQWYKWKNLYFKTRSIPTVIFYCRGLPTVEVWYFIFGAVLSMQKSASDK